MVIPTNHKAIVLKIYALVSTCSGHSTSISLSFGNNTGILVRAVSYSFLTCESFGHSVSEEVGDTLTIKVRFRTC